MDGRSTGRCDHFFFGCVPTCIQKVLLDGSMDKVDLLCHHTDQFPKRSQCNIFHIDAINLDFPSVHIVEA